ncbi:DUF732 domain-containing protein [Mycobacterium sp. NPDC006124]|uniref:DUF732 domain-containing protein n=1 Tax=Mycobacterium sp. NPDC006124 TaxID=3156729 RepID=UPI0033AAD899
MTVASLAASVTIMGAASTLAAPAGADTGADAFLGALTSSGFGAVDPTTAVSVGQSVCPMLSEPGQQVANVAANVSDALGKPLGPATMFTGIAISMFCPAAVASLVNGQTPIPLAMLGI